MRSIFLHEATFQRLADRLKPFKSDICPQLYYDNGDVRQPWHADVDGAACDAIAFGSADIYFSPVAAKFFADVLAQSQLAWFQSGAAGFDHPMLRALGSKAGLFSNSHAQSDAIAEWVIWAGLDHFQNGMARRKAQSAKSWERLAAREISSTRWLILGFGMIGRATGRRLKALGAHVTGLRRSSGTDPDADVLITPDQLNDALGTADAVLLAMPHNRATEAIADTGFFGRMRQGSLFINVGRGALVDEPALLSGLKQNKPGFAALDVFRNEPLSGDSPFWEHPQVMLTPHISAVTQQASARTDALFLENLQHFLNGKPLLHHVRKSTFS